MVLSSVAGSPVNTQVAAAATIEHGEREGGLLDGRVDGHPLAGHLVRRRLAVS